MHVSQVSQEAQMKAGLLSHKQPPNKRCKHTHTHTPFQRLNGTVSDFCLGLFELTHSLRAVFTSHSLATGGKEGKTDNYVPN